MMYNLYYARVDTTAAAFVTGRASVALSLLGAPCDQLENFLALHSYVVGATRTAALIECAGAVRYKFSRQTTVTVATVVLPERFTRRL